MNNNLVQCILLDTNNSLSQGLSLQEGQRLEQEHEDGNLHQQEEEAILADQEEEDRLKGTLVEEEAPLKEIPLQ